MKIISTLFFFLLYLTTANAQNDLQFKNLVTDIDTPWEILWGPDDHIWMTERYGRISRINPENGNLIPLLTIDDVFEEGERGLLGMALHPDFSSNPFVYVVYTYKGGPTGTFVKMVRYKYTGETLIEPLILIDEIEGFWNHDGSRLLFDADNKLYMTMGDANVHINDSQDINFLQGKVLRINPDGTIPDDNPFPDSPVWSWGHRNPQGLVYGNGILYSSEHGPSDNDEVNIIHKGRNYGWPKVRGYCDKPEEEQFCIDSNVVEPILSLYPTYTLAVCGMDYYNHGLIPEWNNSLLLTTLKAKTLVSIKLSDNGNEVVSHEHHFVKEFGRLRDICISPDGRVYIATSNRDQTNSGQQLDDRIIEISKSVGTSERINDKNCFSVEHIPASESLQIQTCSIIQGKGILNVFDTRGSLISSTDISFGQNNNSRIINYNPKPATGVYIAELITDKEIYRKSFLIINFN